MRSKLQISVAIVVLVAVGAALGAGIAITTASSHANTVNACVNRYNGDVRIPRRAGQCASTEFAIDWQRTETGGVDVRTFIEEATVDGFSSDGTRLFCSDFDPDRPVVISGGFDLVQSGDLTVIANTPSRPFLGATPDNWLVVVENSSPVEADYSVYVTCAPEAP